MPHAVRWFRILSLWMLWALVMASPSRVAANAAPPEAAGGGNPGPEAGTPVRMVRERVEITLTKDGRRASVEGVYVMQNTGSQEERLQVLYPLSLFFMQCEGEEIRNLRVWVNDIPAKVQRIQGEPRGEYCDQPTFWAAFPVAFPPGAEVTLRVQYEQKTWGFSPYLVLTYLLETGAGWYGTIGEAEILVHLPYPATPETVVLSEDFWGYGRGTTPGARLEESTVRWVFRDLEPTQDDNIFLLFLEPQAWQEIQRRRQEVKQRPNDGEAWGFLGLAIKKALLLPGPGYPMRFQDQGAQALLQEGLQAYARAVTLKPQDADWHYGYGQLLALAASETQDPAQRAAYLEQAVREFQQALALKPEHEKTLTFLNEMGWLLEGWIQREGDTFRFPGLTATPTFPPVATATPSPEPTRASPTVPYTTPTTAGHLALATPSLAPTDIPASPTMPTASEPAGGASPSSMLSLGILVLLLGCCTLVIVVGGGIFLFRRIVRTR